MSHKLTALITSDKLKLAIILLAVVFLVLDAVQSRSIGALGWLMFCVAWSLPEKVETKTTSKDVA